MSSSTALPFVIFDVLPRDGQLDFEARVRDGQVQAVRESVPVSRIVRITQHKYTKDAVCCVELARPEKLYYVKGLLDSVIDMLNGAVA